MDLQYLGIIKIIYKYFYCYQPEVGHFISYDLIGLLGGDNNFQYAPHPLKWIDHLGLARLRRPYIRKSKRQAIESKEKIKNGRFIDVNTGKPIPGKRRRPFSIAEGKYDLGHNSGHEH